MLQSKQIVIDPMSGGKKESYESLCFQQAEDSTWDLEAWTLVFHREQRESFLVWE